MTDNLENAFLLAAAFYLYPQCPGHSAERSLLSGGGSAVLSPNSGSRLIAAQVSGSAQVPAPPPGECS